MHVQHRNATAADEPFLFSLFACSKALEFASLGWSAEQLQPLLEIQFRARQQSWTQIYPAAVNSILCLDDGAPIGRQLIDRQADCYRIVDLAVVPEYRNRGIGSWALGLVQRAAGAESVALRLHVARTNMAVRLYERLGFAKIAEDELGFEMERRPLRSQPILTQAPAEEPSTQLDQIFHDAAPEMKREEIYNRIFAFLREIGLSIEFAPLSTGGFLPGIEMMSGGLRVDVDALLYPGDLLHEAGHLAVMPPEARSAEAPSSSDPAEEMAALAWSYAAAVHLGIPPEIVFHPHGYRGQASWLLDQFQSGNCIGLPMLWWLGLTTQPKDGTPSIFPKLLCWLREPRVEASCV